MLLAVRVLRPDGEIDLNLKKGINKKGKNEGLNLPRCRLAGTRAVSGVKEPNNHKATLT